MSIIPFIIFKLDYCLLNKPISMPDINFNFIEAMRYSTILFLAV